MQTGTYTVVSEKVPPSTSSQPYYHQDGIPYAHEITTSRLTGRSVPCLHHTWPLIGNVSITYYAPHMAESRVDTLYKCCHLKCLTLTWPCKQTQCSERSREPTGTGLPKGHNKTRPSLAFHPGNRDPRTAAPRDYGRGFVGNGGVENGGSDLTEGFYRVK